jgi:hypothetical protein
VHPSVYQGTNTLAIQRLATYIVISIPNRNSIACGVSHFISKLLNELRLYALPMRNSSNQRHHETELMIFMSASTAGMALLPW